MKSDDKKTGEEMIRPFDATNNQRNKEFMRGRFETGMPSTKREGGGPRFGEKAPASDVKP